MAQKRKNACSKELLLKDVVKDFLTKAKTRLKESTVSRYNSICENHIIPYFGDMKIHKINNEDITNFIHEKFKCGGLKGSSLSAKTVNDMVSLFLQIIKPHCNFDIDITKPSHKQKEISIFTEEEYNRLRAYLSTGTDCKKLGIIIVMLTGIRIGELCALKWENIDLDSGIISIDKTMQRIETTDNTERSKTKIIIDIPKSIASIRAIPTHPILLAELRKFKAPDSSYVLTNTGNYIEPRIYTRHFKDYLKACGLKDNKFHTLRHTFATRAISSGIDIKTVSMLLGHTHVSFTMERYVHPNIEHRRAQIEKLAVGF